MELLCFQNNPNIEVPKFSYIIGHLVYIFFIFDL